MRPYCQLRQSMETGRYRLAPFSQRRWCNCDRTPASPQGEASVTAITSSSIGAGFKNRETRVWPILLASEARGGRAGRG